MSADTKATRTAEQWRDAIHRALPGPKGDGATARAVADAVGLGYSTVTAYLRTMAEDGRVASTREGRNTVWRKLGASPKLTRDEIPTPRAAVVDAAAASAPTPARKKAIRAERLQVERDAQADAPVAAKSPRKRKGEAPSVAAVTDEDEYRAELQAVESDAEAPEPVAVPQAPPAARTPSGGALGDVVGYLEAVRPVSPAPPTPPKATRATRAPRDPNAQPYTTWARGELRSAVLAYVLALPVGDAVTPQQVSTALNCVPGHGSVAYTLDRLCTEGSLTLTSDKPRRYAAA